MCFMVGKVRVELTYARLQNEVTRIITNQSLKRGHSKGFRSVLYPVFLCRGTALWFLVMREQTNQHKLWESHPLGFFIREMLCCRAK